MKNVLTNIKSSRPFHQAAKKPGEIITQSAEVFDIILDDTHIDYVDETSIGIIKFKFISANNISLESNLNTARPIDPNDIKYPLKHEIVLIISAPSANAGIQNDARCFYYTNPIGIWGLVNNNVLPYASTLQTSKVLKFGNYFHETSDCPKLEPQEGDKVISGRFGNYIRFTSTQTQSNKPWNQGVNNAPIIILSTDNAIKNKKVENINKDASSIYITQNTLLGITPSFTKYKSYSTAPIQKYKGAVILLNSDRIHLNSKKDHILFTSEKTVSIAGKTGVHIDAGDKIIFGDTSKASGIPLGKETTDLLIKILDLISQLSAISVNAGITPNSPVMDPLIAQLKLQITLNSHLSSQVYSS